jgi:hypothetical protein
MVYQILNDAGEVINTILAEEWFVEKYYPGHYRLVGPEPAPPPPPPIITKLAFRYRLTDAEYVGILTAAKTDVEVAAWVETFNMVTQVNLDDPRTASGLEMMVTKSLLTEERKTEILTAPVQDSERP